MFFVTFLGFFLGPLFPAAIVVATKILPAEYHVSAIGFASAIGGGGAAILPFVIGAIAQGHGVGVLQPVILVVLVFLIGVWLCLPKEARKRKSRNKEEHDGSSFGESLKKAWAQLTRTCM
jgi:fucose permease